MPRQQQPAPKKTIFCHLYKRTIDALIKIMAMISLIVNCLCRLQLAFGGSDFSAAAFGVSPLFHRKKNGMACGLIAAVVGG